MTRSHTALQHRQQLAIAMRDVSFAWPGSKPCLLIDRFSLDVGQRLFIHGPSGCGKSSLLGVLSGVVTAQSGQVDVLGCALSQMTPKQRDVFRGERLGYLFQQFNLLPYLSAYDNISLPARLFASRMARATSQGLTLRQAIEQLAQALGLSPTMLSAYAHQLSVGQQQRVAAARALLGTPDMLIADEPTSALDADAQQRYVELLLSVAEQHGTTVVMVSHDLRLSSNFDVVLSLPSINRAAAHTDTSTRVQWEAIA